MQFAAKSKTGKHKFIVSMNSIILGWRENVLKLYRYHTMLCEEHLMVVTDILKTDT